jgi:hypothetical protein
VEICAKMKELSAEKVMEILREHGTFVTIEEARIILDFLSKMASISLDQIFG